MPETRNNGLEVFSVVTSSTHFPPRATATCIADTAQRSTEGHLGTLGFEDSTLPPAFVGP
jgi:hypothetical protein